MFTQFTNDNGVWVQVPDNHEFTKWFLPRDRHEPVFRRIITSFYNLGFIDKSQNIIDLGAWIGDNTIPWAANITGTVYAIDPSPRNCQYIRELCHINDVKNVKVIQKAISKDGSDLSYSWDLQHTSFSPSGTHKNNISSVSLDQLFRASEIQGIGMIHLDVEGMEFDVIRGATELIRAFKPVIFFEQHLNTDDFRGLSRYLSGFGYSSYLINEVLPGCNPDCRNFLAIQTHESHRTGIVSNSIGQPEIFSLVEFGI